MAVHQPDNTRWTPVRNGRVFCSPACGGRCTFAEYTKANKDAENLARTLGAGWKPRVWENLGWHFSAEKADASVYEYGKAGSKHHYYSMLWGYDPQLVVDSVTPSKLLLAARQRMVQLRADLASRQMAVFGG